MADADTSFDAIGAVDSGGDPCRAPSGPFRRALRPVAALLIGGGALYAALSMAGGLRDAWLALATVRPAWLVVAAGCEVATFLLLSLHLRALAGHPANARRLAPFRTALVVFGLGSTLPAAPVEGLAMAGRALRHRRLCRRRAVLVLGVSQWFATAGLYVLAALDAIVVALAFRLPFNRGALGAAGAMLLAGIAGLAYVCTRRRTAERIAQIAGRLRSPRHPPPRAERRARGAAWHEAVMHVVPGPRAWFLLVGTTTLAWLADALCLHVALLALGARIDVPLLVLAYGVITIAAQVPFVPAGVGIVETAAPLVLAAGGVHPATGLAAIVVYRAIGTVAPAVAGGAVLAWLRAEPAPEPAPEELAPAAVPAVVGSAVGTAAG